MVDRPTKQEMREDKFAEAVASSIHFLKVHRSAVLLVAALAVVVAVVSVVIVNSRTQSRHQRQVQLSEAMFALQAMNYPQAALLFESFLERYPSGAFSQDARYHAATAQFMAGNLPRAMALFEECLAKEPSDPHLRYPAEEGIADCHEALGEFSQAANLYERLAQDPPQEGLRPVLLSKAGRSYEKAHEWDSVRRVADMLLDEFGDGRTWQDEAGRLKSHAAILASLPAEQAEPAPTE